MLEYSFDVAKLDVKCNMFLFLLFQDTVNLMVLIFVDDTPVSETADFISE